MALLNTHNIVPRTTNMNIFQNKDRNNGEVWKTRLPNRIDALMNEVKLLNDSIVLYLVSFD